MAQNLLFPIGFDLEAGVQKAIKEGDIALRRIEAAMNRKPIVLRAEVDSKKFQTFSDSFSQSIDAINQKLNQANRIWNAMSFDVKFDSDGQLSRRAQVVYDAFQQLTQASVTMGQTLGQVNNKISRSVAETERAISQAYDKQQKLINEQIRLKERQAAAEERVRQSQLKGVNVGYTDTQKQTESVRLLRLQYEALLPMLNELETKRVQIKVGIDKQFDADIQRINQEIARLRQSNLQLGAQGNQGAIQANLQAIQQLEAEIQKINQTKLDLFNNEKINSDIARVRTEVASVYQELRKAEQSLASSNGINSALDAQSQKVLQLHADIQKLDQEIARMNAQGQMYNADGSFTNQAKATLQQRIALTKQLEQEAVTGQQAQIKLEQQLREEQRKTEQAQRQAEKERLQAEKEAQKAREQAIRQTNEENKARQAAYNARRKQGLETQRLLNQEARSISEITVKLQIQQQRLQNAKLGTDKFVKIAAEVRKLTSDLEKANQKMRELTGQTISGASRQKNALAEVTQETSKQHTYLNRLMQRMAAYASVSYVGNFLTQIREITAEFELQRISLGAILQDQAKANQLFSQIKTFALKSPVKILDLTKYTKQLAAYKIGYEELFDTTKRLTDISVGLGVSMDRIVLLYGQVRATGYLRASEVRQATEAGIPLVESLASKLSQVKGEMVSAADVMDMISKRAISFEMVKDVFNDMTSAGGLFYNMQEKQGNTLYGLWAKLGDAASVMYEQIGNTGAAQLVMKGLIQTLTDMMRNWDKIARMVIYTSTTFGVMKAVVSAVRPTILGVRTATQAYHHAQRDLNFAMQFGTKSQEQWAKASVQAAAANRLAATSTNLWTTAKYRLLAIGIKVKAFFTSGNWIGLAITAVVALVAHLVNSYKEAQKLNNELNSIQAEAATSVGISIGRFEQLANTAVKSAMGSREQREALEELKRTYKDILPQEALTIENLQKMKGNYASLTQAIREYISVQQQQKGLSTISEEYGKKITDASRKMIDNMVKELNIDRGLAANIIGELERDFQYHLENGIFDGRALNKRMTDAANKFGVEITKKQATSITSVWWNQRGSYQEDFYDALEGQYNATRDWENRMNSMTASQYEFSKSLEATKKQLDKINYTTTIQDENGADKVVPLGTNTFEYMQRSTNDAMKAAANLILNDNQIEAALRYKMGDKFKETWREEWIHIVDSVNPDDLMDITMVDFDALLGNIDQNVFPELANRINSIRKEWGNCVPTNATVLQIRQKLYDISKAFGISMDTMKNHLWDGSQSVNEYLKTLKEQQKTLEQQLKAKAATLEKMGVISKWWNKLQGKDIEGEIEAMKKELQALQALDTFVTDYVVSENKENDKHPKGSAKSDNRVQVLQEIEQALEKVQSKYESLNKTVGSTKATSEIKKMFEETLAYTNKLGKPFKLNFDYPLDFRTLQKYREEILKVYKTLKNPPKGIEKTILSFETKISEAESNQAVKEYQEQLQKIADKISHTKTAKEFYEKILSTTGDVELATRVSISVYGSSGESLFDDTVKQIKEVFKTGNKEVDGEINLLLDYSIDVKNQRINYQHLAEVYDRFQDQIIESNRKTAESIIKEGQKTTASKISNWEKELAKAKDYDRKREDIINQGTTEREDIIRTVADPKEREDKLTLSREKQSQQLSALNFEEFTKSDDYIKIFENLDTTATDSLKRLREEMQLIIDTDHNLSPENMKTLVKAMEDIDNQIKGRGFGNQMIKSVKNYIDATERLKVARQELAEGQAEYEVQLPQLDADINTAESANLEAQRELNELKGNELTTDVQIAAAQLKVEKTENNLVKAQNKKIKALKKIKKLEKNVSDEQDEQKEAESELFQDLDKTAQAANQLAGELDDVKDLLNISEDSAAGLVFDSAISSLQAMSTAIGIATTAQAIFNAVSESNPYIAIAAAVLAVGVAIASFVGNNKVRKANEEIEKQSKFLEQLEYRYGRLEKALEDAFGVDYIMNFQAQLNNLQLQASAYLKQAEAEKSKGKKADEDKIKDYKDSWRDAMDEIADMRSQLAEQFAGTNRTDLARDMAKSWIDARISMSNTFDAIASDYKDMITNMLVEGAAAKIIDNALTPVYNEMERYLKMGDTDSATDALVNGMDAAINSANSGMELFWQKMEAKGYDLKKILDESDSETTGISKSVSSATSEEINANTAALNTQNFYMSNIDSNVAQIAAMIRATSGADALAKNISGNSTGWTDWQQQAMDNYNAIARNTAENVIECRRAADACERIGRALGVSGSKSGLNVILLN